MPSSDVLNISSPQPTVKVDATFTGDVYLSPLGKGETFSLANVTFLPCARTDWHTHEKGQHIVVIAGKGWICDRGQEPKSLKAGDVVWCEPGVTHWHGADKGSIMTHTVTSFGGVTWLEKVGEEDYAKAK